MLMTLRNKPLQVTRAVTALWHPEKNPRLTTLTLLKVSTAVKGEAYWGYWNII